ncbi:MAG: polysaccharide deacetylase family protein [Bacteroidia bacterium]
MVEIWIKQPSDRLNYVLKWLFEKVYRISYKVRVFGENRGGDGSFILNYTSEIPSPECFSVPNCGLLFGEKVMPSLFTDAEIPYLYYQGESENALSFDIFSAIFFLLTEVEKYENPQLDTHNRYQEQAYLSYQLACLPYPILQKYAQLLQAHFPPAMQAEIERKKSFDYEITFDVDNPWKYKFKPFHVQVGGLLKDIIKGNGGKIKERWAAFVHQKDVYHTFEEVFALCPKEKTRFFFLLYRGSVWDTRYTYEHFAYQQLIKTIHQQGFAVGIHPSYTSSENEKQIAFEIQQLEKILGTKITHSRQHFLKYHHPQTFQALYKQGIRHEYSYCLQKGIGFPNGTAIPFLYYDLSTETETNLLLHPTLVMDRSLQHYLAYSPEKATEEVIHLIKTTQEYGGIFTILFHNEVLSESEEWKGWWRFAREIISTIISSTT